MTHLLNVVRGFLMGAADIVPGVSGGTVALVLGIYERLVHAIRSGAAVLGAAVRLRFSDARDRFFEVDWRLLLPLGAGILIALVSLAAFIERMLEDHPQRTAAVFFGLIAGSIAIAWRVVRRWDAPRVIIGVAVALTAFAVLGLRSGEVADPATWLFLGAGMVAIVAMILPGISGSFILLMIGMYEAVLAAVNARDLAVLAVFVLGAVIGLASFSTLLDRLLRDYHDTVMAALIGLMTGSLRVLWPWPDGTDTAALARPRDWGVPLLLALAGLATVVAIGAVSHRIGRPPRDGERP